MNLRALVIDYIERLKQRSSDLMPKSHHSQLIEDVKAADAMSACADELTELLQETECGFSITDGTSSRQFAIKQKSNAEQIGAERRDAINTLVASVAEFYGIPFEQIRALVTIGLREGIIRATQAATNVLLEDDLWNE